MRPDALTLGMRVAFLVGLTMGSNTAWGASTCEDLLDNNVYRCSVKGDSVDPFEDCFRFSSPGVQSSDFDLNIDLLGIPLGCDCKPKGSLKKPSFSASKSYFCVATALGGFGIAFEGTATPKKINKGTVVDEFGASYIYECVLDAACSIANRARTPGGPYKR